MKLQLQLLHPMPILLLLLCICIQVAPSTSDNDCILECAHSSTCHRSSSSDNKRLAQSGRLVDSCQCPTNYGGVACDIPLHTCSSNKDCGQGPPCQGGLCTNACAAVGMWLRSEFAQYACRKAVTEYCSSSGGGEYCTNGGKCTEGYQGAAAINVDKSKVCACPLEFTGTHCERVKLPASISLPAPYYAKGSNNNTMMIVFGSFLGAVVLILFVFIVVLRRRPKRRNSGTLTTTTTGETRDFV